MAKEEVKPKKIEKKSMNQLFEDFSMKEMAILVLGLIIILGSIIFVPKWWNDLTTDEPKSLDELHADNFLNPETENSFIYEGYSFVKLPDARTDVEFWYTQYQRDGVLFNVPFRYSPREVEYVQKVSVNKTQVRPYSQIYITVDPNDEPGSQQYTALAVGELTEILVKVKSYPMVGACTNNQSSACLDRPIITCEDRGDFLTFYFKESNETRVVINDNCITIEGMDESLIAAADRTVYGFLGIMD